MGQRFSFEFKITGILLVILALVTITGIYAYQRFSEIISDISENVRPDARLLTAESLLNDVNGAELSVKSFRITKDTIYLEQFYVASRSAEYKLTELHRLSDEYGDYPIEIDSLEKTIQQKIEVLTGLLLLQDEMRVQMALEKVAERVETATDELAANGELSNSFVLNKFFKRKKKTTETVADSTKKIDIATVKKEVDQLKKEEQTIGEEIKTKELQLIAEDQILRGKITSILEELRAFEVNSITEETDRAEKAIERTNQQIALFCVTTGALLLFMAFIIINYVRNNNRYRKALRISKQEAEDLAATKQRFLANMSHEIRTPMNAIAGFTEQISKGTLAKEQREQLTMVSKATEHLLYLIDEVLDFSKLQADKLKLEKIGFRPAEVINDIAAFFRSSLQNKELLIECQVAENVPEVLIGDPFRLRQILLNLVSNSVKFTDHGTVLIKTSVANQTPELSTLRIEVIDSGIGMDKKHLRKVFKEFEQAEASTSRNYGGTGLGLAIVNMLVNLHHGSITLHSTRNKGTRVVIELTYLNGTLQNIISEKADEKTIEESELSGLNVLVVDDEEYNRKLLEVILKGKKAIYTGANNGVEAIEKIIKNDYDLILMDARMPELDGIETTIKIREMHNPKKNSTPIIALSAAISNEDRTQYLMAGMNGFLAKPFKENQLMKEISRVFKHKTLHGKSANPAVPQNDTATLDFDDLKELSNGDLVFYTEMLQTFIDGTQKGMEDIRAALDANNWRMIAEYAHKISAPCRHLGAIQLYTYLKEIENKCRNTDIKEPIEDLIVTTELEAEKVVENVQTELERSKAKT